MSDFGQSYIWLCAPDRIAKQKLFAGKSTYIAWQYYEIVYIFYIPTFTSTCSVL